MSSELGPPIGDDEEVYKAILSEDHWFGPENRPSSAAFSNDYFSVDVKSRTTPEESWDRHSPKIFHLISFNCGNARTLDYDTRDEPDDKFPNNKAHAHVYMIGYHEIPNTQRKKKAKRMVEICCKVSVDRSRTN